MNRRELSEQEQREVELEARVDAADGVTRTYKGDSLTDTAFGIIDALTGSSNSGDTARAKQEHYDATQKAINSRS